MWLTCYAFLYIALYMFKEKIYIKYTYFKYMFKEKIRIKYTHICVCCVQIYLSVKTIR